MQKISKLRGSVIHRAVAENARWIVTACGLRIDRRKAIEEYNKISCERCKGEKR